MPETHSRRNSLIVAGSIAAGVGLLAWGVRGGRPLPGNVKEALESFRNPKDAYRAAKVKVMGELLGRASIHADELMAHVSDPNEPEELARRRLLRTMAGLGKATLGDFAFAQLAGDLDQFSYADHYQATDVAKELYDSGQLPEITAEAS
jgi:hypothetical protein